MAIHRPIIAPIHRPIHSPVDGGLPWDRGIGGAPAWTPAALTNLRGWYRADTVTLDPTNVTTWPNKSTVGTTNDLGSAAAGNRPLWVATGFNGTAQPYVEFDGANEWLRVAAFSWGSTAKPVTVCAVLNVTAPTANDAIFQAAPSIGYALVNGTGVPATCLFGLVTSVGTTALTTSKMFTFAWDGTTQKVFIGTTQEDSDANAGAAAADGGIFSLSAGTAGAATLPAQFAEVIVMRAGITTAELASLYAYASARYGV